MASPRLRARLLIAEAIVCFALPAYILFWGIVTAPAWYYAWMRGGTYAAWSLSYIVGGCLGMVGVVPLVRYVAGRAGKFAAARNITLGVLGLAAIWGSVTADFKSFQVDPFTLLAAMLPSLCAAHFVVLALKKSRSVPSG